MLVSTHDSRVKQLDTGALQIRYAKVSPLVFTTSQPIFTMFFSELGLKQTLLLFFLIKLNENSLQTSPPNASVGVIAVCIMSQRARETPVAG